MIEYNIGQSVRQILDLDNNYLTKYKEQELYRAINNLNSNKDFNIFIKFFLEILPLNEMNYNSEQSEENLKHLKYFKLILKQLYYEKPS